MKRIALILLLYGCTTVSTVPYKYSAKISDSKRCYLVGPVIVWSSASEVTRECGEEFDACVRDKVVFTSKPKSWNDLRALEKLGHEVLHLCGEQHEVVK